MSFMALEWLSSLLGFRFLPGLPDCGETGQRFLHLGEQVRDVQLRGTADCAEELAFGKEPELPGAEDGVQVYEILAAYVLVKNPDVRPVDAEVIEVQQAGKPPQPRVGVYLRRLLVTSVSIR